MEIIDTKRGLPCLILDGFRFRIRRKNKLTVAWRCCSDGCPSSCVTDPDFKSLIKRSTEQHNHDKCNEKDLNLERVKTAVKRKAEGPTSNSVSKVICEEAVKAETVTYRDIKNLKDCFYRRRLKGRPTLPKCREELCKTIKETSLEEYNINIMKEDANTNIVILSTIENLHHLANCTIILGDGTFKTCPKFYLQLYTLHGYNNGSYTACVYCLLPDKKKSTYEIMLSLIAEACTENNVTLDPTVVQVDLEMAFHLALRSTWPSCDIRACHFHLAQAWFRKIQSLGLVNDFKEKESELGRWLKLYFVLPILTPEEIEDCFAFTIMNDQPDDDRARLFTDYIYDKYLTSSSAFPPSLWAGIASQEVTTTNACESFHLHFSQNLNTEHPNIFRFLEAIKHEQEKTMLKLRSKGMPAPKKRKLMRDKKDRREALIEKYRQGNLSQAEFLHEMSTKMCPRNM